MPNVHDAPRPRYQPLLRDRRSADKQHDHGGDPWDRCAFDARHDHFHMHMIAVHPHVAAASHGGTTIIPFASIALLAAALAAASCSASYPASPSETGQTLALRLHYRFPSGPVAVRSVVEFTAYTFDSNHLYEDVTSRATWVSADPVVARVAGAGRFVAIEPGTTEIFASFGGFSASAPVVVGPVGPLPHPRIEVRPRGATVGSESQSGALFFEAPGASRDVTELATWASSDPNVATVENGLVRGRAPGTVEITASYNGISAWYRFSVPPISFFAPRP